MKKENSNFMRWFQILIEKEITKQLNNKIFIKEWVAKVDSINTVTNKVNVKLPNSNEIIELSNETGQTLNVGDNVYLHSPTGNLSNSWIIKKF